MDYQKTSHRLGATAIAAVLALSSTPIAAQVADPLGPTADVIPVDTPVVAAPAVEQQPVISSAPAPTGEVATPAADTQPVTKSTKAKAVRTSPAREIAPRPTADNSAPSAMAAPTADAPPIVADPKASPEPLPAAAETAPPVTEPVAEAYNSDLPLMAGGAGLAAIALLGTGIVASRRRRRRDDMVLDQQHIERPVTEPRFDRAPAAAVAEERSAFAWGRHSQPQPSATSTRSQTLPSGFDMSRFGRHVQAAYRGPTPDNPSLSLKRRLKRASFFDMKERQARSTGSFGRTPELMPA